MWKWVSFGITKTPLEITLFPFDGLLNRTDSVSRGNFLFYKNTIKWTKFFMVGLIVLHRSVRNRLLGHSLDLYMWRL